MANFYGVPNVKMISHGEWADPELIYDGYFIDYYVIEDTLYDIFKEDHDEYNATMDEYIDKETGEVVSFEKWVHDNADLVYEILDDAIDNQEIYVAKNESKKSKKVKEAYWENENNPKKAYKTVVKYKLFKDDDTYVGEKENGYYVFEDTYYIDSDYSADEVSNYIINDALLVCGGGYSKKNIKEAIVKINGRVVYKFDNSKTESKRNDEKKRLGEEYTLDDGSSIDTWEVVNGLKRYCSVEHDLDAVEEALYRLETLATTKYNKDTYEPLYRFLVDASGNL